MRRLQNTAAAGLVALLLGGCSSVQGPGVVSVAGIDLAGSAPAVRQADATDETLIATRLSDGSSGTFRPIASRDGVTTWAAPDGSAFAFRSGMLVSSFALGDDLYSADVADVLVALRERRTGPLTRVHRYLDGENEVRTRTFRCTLSFGAVREAPNGGSRVRPVSERCHGVGDGFRNEYLVSAPADTIVASTQWISGSVGSIRFSRGTPRPAQTVSPILVPATLIVVPREAP